MGTEKQNPLGLPRNNNTGLGAPGEMPSIPAKKINPAKESGLAPPLLLGLLGGKRRKTNARRKARSLKRRNNKSTRRR
jgi:hypothetical protein